MARLPKSLIKKYGISKKAWRIFKARGNSARPRLRRKPTRRVRRTTTRKRGVRRMARKKRRRGGKSLQRTAFKLIRLGALVLPAAHVLMTHGSIDDKIDGLALRYTGFSMKDGKFHGEFLVQGWGPFLAAVATTYGIPKIAGIIRSIK